MAESTVTFFVVLGGLEPGIVSKSSPYLAVTSNPISPVFPLVFKTHSLAEAQEVFSLQRSVFASVSPDNVPADIASVLLQSTDIAICLKERGPFYTLLPGWMGTGWFSCISLDYLKDIKPFRHTNPRSKFRRHDSLLDAIVFTVMRGDEAAIAQLKISCAKPTSTLHHTPEGKDVLSHSASDVCRVVRQPPRCRNCHARMKGHPRDHCPSAPKVGNKPTASISSALGALRINQDRTTSGPSIQEQEARRSVITLQPPEGANSDMATTAASKAVDSMREFLLEIMDPEGPLGSGHKYQQNAHIFVIPEDDVSAVRKSAATHGLHTLVLEPAESVGHGPRLVIVGRCKEHVRDIHQGFCTQPHGGSYGVVYVGAVTTVAAALATWTGLAFS